MDLSQDELVLIENYRQERAHEEKTREAEINLLLSLSLSDTGVMPCGHHYSSMLFQSRVVPPYCSGCAVAQDVIAKHKLSIDVEQFGRDHFVASFDEDECCLFGIGATFNEAMFNLCEGMAIYFEEGVRVEEVAAKEGE